MSVTGGSDFWFEGSFSEFNLLAAGFSLEGGRWGGTIYNAEGVKVGTYW